MNKETLTKNNDSFQEEINKLAEWQDNQYNLGYYVGTGKIPLPLKRLRNRPIVVLLLSSVLIIPLTILLILRIIK